MFTGIIEQIGKAKKVSPKDGGLSLMIQINLKTFKVGESVALDGVCLTVVKKQNQKKGTLLSFELAEETLKKTTFKDITIGAQLNLERSLKMGSPLGGHFVQGHIDGIGKISKIELQGNSKLFFFSYPFSLEPYIVPKGSIAINGISLTVVESNQHNFSVSILPFTENQTSLKDKKIGDEVNLETDIIAKIVAQQTKNHLKSALDPGSLYQKIQIDY